MRNATKKDFSSSESTVESDLFMLTSERMNSFISSIQFYSNLNPYEWGSLCTCKDCLFACIDNTRGSRNYWFVFLGRVCNI